MVHCVVIDAEGFSFLFVCECFNVHFQAFQKQLEEL